VRQNRIGPGVSGVALVLVVAEIVLVVVVAAVVVAAVVVAAVVVAAVVVVVNGKSRSWRSQRERELGPLRTSVVSSPVGVHQVEDELSKAMASSGGFQSRPMMHARDMRSSGQ
jgi:hypothetical protein